RLLVNGALDTSFNRTGYTGVFASLSSPTTLLRQPDGKLLLAGTAYHKLAIARFNANGVIESAFGKFGRTTIDLPATPSESITALSLQSDGKILAATDAGSIVRFSAAGKLDATFGRNGVLAERAPKDVSFNSTAIIQP